MGLVSTGWPGANYFVEVTSPGGHSVQTGLGDSTTSAARELHAIAGGLGRYRPGTRIVIDIRERP